MKTIYNQWIIIDPDLYYKRKFRHSFEIRGELDDYDTHKIYVQNQWSNTILCMKLVSEDFEIEARYEYDEEEMECSADFGFGECVDWSTRYTAEDLKRNNIKF